MSYNRIIKNIVYLFAGNMSVRIISAIASILIARYLGTENFGILSVAIAFATVAGYFTDLGLTHTLMREGTKPEANISSLMGGFLRIRITFSLFTALVSGLIIFNFYDDPILKQVLFLMVLPTIFGASLQGVGVAYFQVTQEMKYSALIRSLSGTITAGALFLAMVLNWSLHEVAVTYGLSSIIGGMYSFWLVARRVNLFYDWDKSLLKGLGSFTVAGIAMMLIPQLGPLILEKVNTLNEVGFFAAAYRFPSLLYQVPAMVAAAFYPALFQLGNSKDEIRHLKLSILELKIMSGFGILVSLPFIIYPEWIVKFMLGVQWLDSSDVLQLLAWIVIIQSINYPLADSLTTKGMQQKRTRVLIIAFVLGIFLYVFLGKQWGAMGAGIAAIILELFLLVSFIYLNPTGWKLFKQSQTNLLGLATTILLSYLVFESLNPILGMALNTLVFSTVVLSLDSELRLKLAGWIVDRLKKGVKIKND